MSATNQLRADHDQVRRLEKVVLKCADELYKGTKIPFSDLRKITIVISEFVDTIHHSREEDSYFPCDIRPVRPSVPGRGSRGSGASG